MKDKEVTTGEILEAINIFAEDVDLRFDAVDLRFEAADQYFEGLEHRLNRVESLMVTKDYLDDKLANLRGDLVSLIRKQGSKVDALILTLKNNRGLSLVEAEKLLAMQPFPLL
ncbi:MAG: hypothetical protein ABH826_03870 [Patescibacteria group bacterium]|nr:hypothetical protein [Patescibacteria group bacterium]